ncbi:putative dehalogenase [Triangularia verruculosa]|uniref:Dehalogenase n=1 Tax=Triangularia verruculosa TaxID=2587418 RepID=A0AAN6XNA4_9PEZI|nr:putative dehalogenase [Triangularia verruculosa]
MTKTTIAFDLYGTLLSPASISASLSSTLSLSSQKAEELAGLWRRYQLEYTWRSNSMGIFTDFASITRSALKHVVPDITGKQIESIMSAYDNLEVFPEVPGALGVMEENGGLVEAYVFSNGTRGMVEGSLKGLREVFRGVVCVEGVGRYKPDPKVYEYLVGEVGREKGEVWLVSGNPFDVLGAKAAGLRACWVDREGGGWVDRLGDGLGVEGGGRPDLVVKGVDEGVEGIIAWAKGGRE